MKEVQVVESLPNRLSGFSKVLAVGPAGSGKTTQFCTLPGRKFAYLFDPHAKDSLIKGVEYVEFIPDITDLHIAARTLKKADETSFHDAPVDATEPMTYREFEEDFTERYRKKFFNDYDWVGVDSSTTLDEIILDRVLHLAKRPGKHPEQSDHTASMNTFRNLIRALTAVSNVYLTAHLEMRQDELSKRIFYQPFFTGRNRIRIPLRFSECVVLTKEAGEGTEGERYMMHVESTREYPFIRSTIPRRKGFHGPLNVTLNFKKALEGQGLGHYMK